MLPFAVDPQLVADETAAITVVDMPNYVVGLVPAQYVMPPSSMQHSASCSLLRGEVVHSHSSELRGGVWTRSMVSTSRAWWQRKDTGMVSLLGEGQSCSEGSERGGLQVSMQIPLAIVQ